VIYRATFRALIIVALALGAWVGWLWLLYGARAALWLRREYLVAALGSVVLIGIVVSFQKARRGKSIAGASIETGVTVLGCAGVVATAYVSSVAIAYLVGRYAL
jgi:hypothetical protein